MNLRKILIKVWQRRTLEVEEAVFLLEYLGVEEAAGILGQSSPAREIGEVVSLLEELGAEKVAEALGELSRQEISVNKTEKEFEQAKEAATCVR